MIRLPSQVWVGLRKAIAGTSLSVLGLGLAIGNAHAAFTPPAELTVVSDINYPPYLFPRAEGGSQGILPERWALWSKRTGVPVRVLGMEWAAAQRSVQEGTHDILETVSYSEARTKLYEFSLPYAPIDARVYFHQSITGINDVTSMRGFAIGAKAGSACRNWLVEHGITTLQDYPTSESLVKAAAAGEVRLFCLDSPAANYFLFKLRIADHFRQTSPLYSTNFHWAVRKGQTDLRDFIQAGFDKFTPQELEEINEHWLGNPLRFPLSSQFMAYTGLAAACVVGLALALIAWNTGLQRRVTARTRDLISALQAEKASMERVEDLYNHAPCGYHTLDMDGVFLEINETELRWLGCAREELIDKRRFQDFMTPESHLEFDSIFSAIKTPAILSDLQFDLIRKDGSRFCVLMAATVVHDQAGSRLMNRATLHDITERRKSEERIQKLAFYDQLTGLPNRLLLLDRLKQTMATCTRKGTLGALLFIDLDHFKVLNDTLGHDVGDELLGQVAIRLRQSVRESDTVARFGGDEFAVVLAGMDTGQLQAEKAIHAVVDKILTALNQPYQLGDASHHGTASIGVTLLGKGNFSSEDLMKQADLAMYKSKAAGRDIWHFFDPQMESTLKARAALEGEIRRGIDQQQFLLHYQAQVTGTGTVTGAEALVRWQHPERGLVSPGEFIPVAEETGLILPLGQWVLEVACTQLARWGRQPETAHFIMAVNVSANQFNQSNFVDEVLSVLKSTGANPQRLKLELTETVFLSKLDTIIEKMFALRAKGVGFSLDDFGTGYSSLMYLKRLPLDQLKIDQSYVRDILTDHNDAVIAKTIVLLAHSLGLNVIAEGVETEAQRHFLAQAGCVAYQGYLFSRPLPIEAFERLVQQQSA